MTSRSELRYQASTKNFVLFAGSEQDVKKARDANMRPFSQSMPGAGGRPVFFSRSKYAALAFRDVASSGAYGEIARWAEQVDLSYAKDADFQVPAPEGLEYMPFQRAGMLYASQRERTLIADDMGLGKEQPLTARILTPTGWTTMGALKVGDAVIDKDGMPCRVTGIFPQGVKPVYRVSFWDGTSTECGRDHLWMAREGNRRTRHKGTAKEWAVYSLGEMMAHGVRKGFASVGKWDIPVMAAVDAGNKSPAFSPYLMGVLIGDGALTGSTPCFSCPDSAYEIVQTILTGLPEELNIRANRAPRCPQYYITAPGQRRNPLLTEVRRLGLNVLSGSKFIPDEFFEWSLADRVELLRGLMDTDGSIHRTARGWSSAFHTTSDILAEDVASLVRSLGGIAKVHFYERAGKPDEYHVNVKTKVCPFTLTRKAEHWAPQHLVKMIAEIEYVRNDRQQCISVDSPSHTYVTDDYIVTHNTVQAIGLANLLGSRSNLVVCPASVRLNWAKKIAQWTTQQNAAIDVVTGKKGVYTETANWTVISYSQMLYTPFVYGIMDEMFDLLIFDESHNLKNPDAGRTAQAYKFFLPGARRVLFLDGTPMKNKVRDVWTVARAACPESIDNATYTEFIDAFNPDIVNYTTGEVVANRGVNLVELKMRLRAHFMVRRLKVDVLEDLPPSRFDPVYLAPDGQIRKVLKEEKPFAELDPDLISRMAAGGSDMGKLARLRRVMGEAKVPAVADLVRYLLDDEQNNKLLVFAHHRSVIDRLAEALKAYRPVTYHGGTSASLKESNKATFVEDSRCRVFIGQVNSAGVGVDGLQEATDLAVFAEFSWVYYDNQQALDRLCRIGQKNAVRGILTMIEKSLDERMLRSNIQKASTAHLVLN